MKQNTWACLSFALSEFARQYIEEECERRVLVQADPWGKDAAAPRRLATPMGNVSAWDF